MDSETERSDAELDSDVTAQEVDPGPRLNLPDEPKPDPYTYVQAIERHAVREPSLQDRLSKSSRLIALIGLVACLVMVALLVLRPGGALRGDARPEAPVEPSGVAFCRELDRKTTNLFEAAIQEMRSVGNGEELYRLLVERSICLEVDKLGDFVSCFSVSDPTTSAPFTPFIVIDFYALEIIQPDELAAILVHEATHAQRLFEGTSCYLSSACTLLPNGVELEEEVVAHRAEALWWGARHGPTGTSNGVSFEGAWKPE